MPYQSLQRIYPYLNVLFDTPLAHFSYTKTGGNADAIVFPKTRQEVVDVILWTRENNLPLTILGNLSNLIVRDGGIRGVVLILTDMSRIEVDQNVVYADAGAKLIEVTHVARDKNLTGLEFACGIPGSVGGGVYMNAGAYGGEIKDLPIEVDVVTDTGEFKTYSNDQINFSYRYSVFQDNGDIILGTRFYLEPGEVSEIQEKMDHLTFLRESKQPLEYPSCGSVFKRPEGYFTGKLIQDAGLQGHRIGGAEISKKHAGFIINVGDATATDYIQMIEFIQEVIWERNQVKLETEVRILGEEL